ncbi:hypothetical protein CTI12_AA262530 [Artemisia annua]|uniref:SWIM-type domain-containing protein n=1 Tax=Artemisia annua TaxID=35608 RepID=A0A2U1NIE5_ARTAN|nr:hypothetical protein CTI12_AA262530 [Artemisia annua]
MNYDEKQTTDINFEGMSFVQLFDVLRHLVHNPLRRLYYCKVGTPLRISIKEITNDDVVQAFLTCAYESKWVVDLYAEHLDEDALECRNSTEAIHTEEGYESSDYYCSSDEEDDLGDVEFFHEGDENVEIENVPAKDLFLNKLCSNSGEFKGFIDEPVNVNEIEVLDDPDPVDAKYIAKPHIIYPRHDPTQDRDKMKPVLGMRFESNEQLKLALANYGVHNGYQLWDILVQRTKPIITMLEDIRLYVMQGLVAMNRTARLCKDSITPSIRKRLDKMIQFQLRYWHVVPSGFQELEVRSGSQAYGVNLTRKKCMCGMWELSRIPCIHAVAAYEHMNRDTVQGVQDWPVYGSSMWKRTRDLPLLPPLMGTMPGRPKKKRIIAPDGNTSQVTIRGRIMTCSNCQERGHNKSSCKKEPVPKPPKPARATNNTTTPDITTNASARGGGRGSRGRKGARGGGRGSRGGGRGSRGGGRGSRGGGRGQKRTMFMDEDEIRKIMHHEYIEDLLIQEEDRIAALDRERLEQEAFDEEAMRLTLEEEERWKEQDLKREQDEHAEHVEWEKNMGLHPSCYMSEDESFDQEPYNREQVSVNDQIKTQESIFVGIRDAPLADDALLIPEVVDAPCDPNDDAPNKGKAVVVPEPKKKVRKRQTHDDPLRIYHKNRGRSESIFGQKMKKTGFGENGEGSTPDTAFSVDEP